MDQKHATVKDQDSAGGPASAHTSPALDSAERIRRELADAWGRLASAWGVAPAVAKVHAYLLARRDPVTEREVRLALGLSHRAASLALAESEAWGLAERVPELRRSGRRGPAGVAYVAVGDHWRWFGRVVAQRKLREADPVLVALAAAAGEAVDASRADPNNAELADLAAWLTDFVGFVRLFDRAVGLVPQIAPRDTQAGFELLGRIPDDVALRLVGVLAALPPGEVVPLLTLVSRLSPAATRRVLAAIRPLVARAPR